MGRKARARRNYHIDMILSSRQKPGPFPFVLVLDHLKAGFNAAKIMRSANAFGCREVHLVGMTAFDPSAAVGGLRHTRTEQFPTFAASYERLVGEGYTIYALAPTGEHVMGRFPLPERSALVLGHEQKGLSFELSAFPLVQGLRIPQFGLVQSLNVAVAAGLACYEYVRQRDFQRPAGTVSPLELLEDATV